MSSKRRGLGAPELRAHDSPRVVALDYDGTITERDVPSAGVLAEMRKARQSGIRLVLVTGRIRAELDEVFPEVMDHVDVLVSENGAVLTSVDGTRTLARAVDQRLVDGLRRRGCDVRRGEVIVAGHGVDEHAVLDEMRLLGLEAQLVRNRTEVMVLPPGVNKGSGLAHALAELGVSRHDTLAVGDAENDHSLLQAAEVGVAVANAVPALQEIADHVTEGRAGDGVVELLRDLRGPATPWAGGGRLLLGNDSTGAPVSIPSRPANILIGGESGSGKSHLAGLLMEQLIDQGYSVLLVDPEGDHQGLGALSRAVLLGGEHPLPDTDTVLSLLHRPDTSVVIDLSGRTAGERDAFYRELLGAVRSSREEFGRPHWLFLDEAHAVPASEDVTWGSRGLDPDAHGTCLVTWRPEELGTCAEEWADTVIMMTTPLLTTPPVGRCVVVRKGAAAAPVVSRPAERRTHHFRHERKYDHTGLSDRAFWFHHTGHSSPAPVENLQQLLSVLPDLPLASLRHHAPRGDLSRWINEVLHDSTFASSIEVAERRITAETPDHEVAQVRRELAAAVERRLSS